MTAIDAYRLLAREHGLRAPICPLVLGKLQDKLGADAAHQEIARLIPDAELASKLSAKLHEARG